jgi:TP901 family phage tail tape measure protein
MSKLLKLGIEIGASLKSGFTSVIGNARMSLGEIKTEIKSLSQTRLQIDEFRKLSQSAGDNKARMDELSKALRKAGVDVGNLDRHSRTLGDTLKNLQKRASIKVRIEANRKALDDAKGSLLGIAASVTGAGLAARGLISAQSDVQKAQGEIGSLGITESGIQSITKAAQAFSNTWAGTTTAEFVSASYDIKSGISSLGDAAVGEFTRIAALTASATKSTTDEMTSLFSKGFGIYRKQFDALGQASIAGWKKMSEEERDIEFGKYFSAGISSAVRAFRTKGSEMSSALSTLGGAATTAGMSFSEQLSILGVLQAQMSGSEAATKLRSFLRNASKGGKALKLDFVDDQTGMLESIPNILEQISERFGGVIDQKAIDKMTEAFGDAEASAFIQGLMDKRDALRKGSVDITKSLSGGLKLTTEMATSMQRGRGFDLLGQQATNLSSALGQSLYPAAGLVAGALGVMSLRVQELSANYPRLTSTSFGLIGGLVGVLIAAKTLGIVALWLKGGWLNLEWAWKSVRKEAPKLAAKIAGLGNTMALTELRTKALAVAQKAWAIGSTIVTAATTAISTAFRAMGLAIASNPIGFIIAGIAIAATLIITYWEPIKGFFIRLWGGIKNAFAAVAPYVMKVWQPIAGFFSAVWGGIKSVFSAGVSFLLKILKFTPFGPMIAAARLVITHWQPISGFFSGLWSGIKSAFSIGASFLMRVLSFTPLGLIITHWQPISGFFSGLWSGIKSAFSIGASFLMRVLSFTPLGLIITHWQPISGFFSGLWNGIKSAFSIGASFLMRVLSFTPLGLIITHWQPILDFFTGLWDKIKGLFSAGIDGLKKIWDPIKGLFKGIWAGYESIYETGALPATTRSAAFGAARTGAIPKKTPIPAFAAGGIVSRPTIALLGEAGPEAVVPLKSREKPRGLSGFPRMTAFSKIAASLVLGATMIPSTARPAASAGMLPAIPKIEISISPNLQMPTDKGVRPESNPALAKIMESWNRVNVEGDVRGAITPAAENRDIIVNVGGITINTHPGMDAKAVAEEVDRKLRERESRAAARSRGTLYD